MGEKPIHKVGQPNLVPQFPRPPAKGFPAGPLVTAYRTIQPLGRKVAW